MAGSNPKFLNTQKKVVYNIRLPQRLLDKYNAYSELNGNTTTNVVTTVLEAFISDKVVLNDYLDNKGGITLKIPFVPNQKHTFILNEWNLKDYTTAETLKIYDYERRANGYEPFNAELFEIKKIPNNLDIHYNDSYIANKDILMFNHNAEHSGIELFVYNISDIIFEDKLMGAFDSFINCLYCLYFEISSLHRVDVYLIDYLTAINLLSASNNEYYKNLIIAVATELEKINDQLDNFFTEYNDVKDELKNKYLADEDKFKTENSAVKNELKSKYLSKCKSEVDKIADKYNSGNIIKFGTDIFSRVAIENAKFTPDDFDELIDKKINKKIEKLEKENTELKSKLKKINDMFDTLDNALSSIDNYDKLTQEDINELLND